MRRVAALCLAATIATACSPALNWRQVQLGQLTVMLPCKPDHAQRTVPLDSQTLAMDMVGCEASGALFAVSHVRTQATQVDAVQAAWRKAILANLQAGTVKSPPLRLAKLSAGQQDAKAQSASAPVREGQEILIVTGKGSDGHAVQARLLWFAHAQDIYHVAVIGPELTDDMVEPLFSDLVLH